ncbi:EF-hand domain-containing protein [Palleronia caenipelagi]|uniref:EF-hand domain-containing protein n=1 Tax=Palleronia caenipelagi TaxID=2489174 RepID=A0A547PLZ4_9RHOB|nr:EF-hand domain-containing protein [Palleronia caenipelagi]TRD15169.1 EF-hand domain-containing protein [Palleronia caenipelagi]
MHKLFLAGLIALIPAVPALSQGERMPGQHFLENWDADGDGAVSLEEVRAKRSDVFFMFDQNEDGALDSGEYDLFDSTRKEDMAANAGGQGGGMGRAQKGFLRDFNDRDGDGRVTEEEFVDASDAFLELVDRDGDDRLTTSDFGRK